MTGSVSLNIGGAGAEPQAIDTEAPAGVYRTIEENPPPNGVSKPVDTNMVKENGENCQDGADEKMLNEEEKKITIKPDSGDVKYVSGDQQNGDTKVDILEIKQAFTGLTKEELMKYCNDPFWVRLRWTLFISFWLIWLGMLAGAIYIVVGAPKCAPPPPKTWWEEGPLLDLDAPKDNLAKTENNPAKYFETLVTRMPLLGSFKGVIIPESVNPGTDAYSSIISSSNTSEFKDFVKKANEKHVKVIVELTPNFINKANEWFVKSEQKDSIYKDYFIWADEKGTESGERIPPNNWISTMNKPAWTYSETRKQFYLHQFDESTPDLNFRNPRVVEEFDKVLQYWLENGASGVRLSKVKHLLVDSNMENETIPSRVVGAVQTDYSFYVHDKTTSQEGLANILKHWKTIIQKYSDSEGLLMLKDDFESFDVLKYNGTLVVDLPRISRSKASQPTLEHTAKTLQQSLKSARDILGFDSWPSWQYESGSTGVSSELRFVSMLLPGTPVIAENQIVASDDGTTLNDAELKSLVELRSSPSIMYGEYDTYLLANETVFAYCRLKPGNPGFMVVYNPTENSKEVDVAVEKNVPSEVTVKLLSKNYSVKDVTIKSKFPATNVTISAKSALILTYAPAQD